MVDTPDKLLDIDYPYRFILSPETDANSPDNEVTYGQMRLNFEAFFRHSGGVKETGSVLYIPNDSPDGLLITDGVSAATGSLVGCLVVIQTGDAIGNVLYITANSNSGAPFYEQTFTLSSNLAWEPGDPLANLWALGVTSLDQIAVTYHALKNSHDHDGKNSAPLGPGSIGQSQLKLGNGSGSGIGTVLLPTGGPYAFHIGCKMPLGSGAIGELVTFSPFPGTTSFNYGTIFLKIAGFTQEVQGEIQYLYVTASGEVNWVFVLEDRETGAVLGFTAAPDHPCFGQGSPELRPHPFHSFDPETQKITVINPDSDQWKSVELARYPTSDGGYLDGQKLIESVNREKRKGNKRGNPYEALKDLGRPLRGFREAFDSQYIVNAGSPTAWPTKPVSVALPSFDNDGNLVGDWRTKTLGGPVNSIKMAIPKPKDIKTASLLKVSKKEAAANVLQMKEKFKAWELKQKKLET